MSIQPILNPSAIDNKSLNLYCNSITSRTSGAENFICDGLIVNVSANILGNQMPNAITTPGNVLTNTNGLGMVSWVAPQLTKQSNAFFSGSGSIVGFSPGNALTIDTRSGSQFNDPSAFILANDGIIVIEEGTYLVQGGVSSGVPQAPYPVQQLAISVGVDLLAPLGRCIAGVNNIPGIQNVSISVCDVVKATAGQKIQIVGAGSAGSAQISYWNITVTKLST